MAELVGLPRTAISKVENDKMELKLSDAARWGQATQMPEVIAAIICGVDTAAIIQGIATLIGGFILWI